MSRLYISKDQGAGALVAAAWDRWGVDGEGNVPEVDEVISWGRERGFSWTRSGLIWHGGTAVDGKELYGCGFPGNPHILIRAWNHLLPLLKEDPLQWEFAQSPVSAPVIRSWERFRSSYGRMVKVTQEGWRR